MEDTGSSESWEGVGLAVARGPACGSAAAGPVVWTPPSTNRGCFTPLGGTGESKTGFLSVGLDYLRITVFGSFDEVLGLVESELLESGSLLPGWVSKGPVQRWERLEVFGDDLVQIKAPKSAQVPYAVVELKGDGCSAYQDQLHGFLASVDRSYRWNGKRCDARWDHHWLSPELVSGAIQAGEFVSRSLNVGDWDWRANLQGETCYLGSREKPRHVRWYNKRGFNRMELELSDEWAADLLRKFVKDGPASFARHALGYLLTTVDFRETGTSTRGHRAPRHDWWDGFIGAAEKVKTLTKTGERVGCQILPIGAADQFASRNRRMILRVAQALGPGWLLERAKWWSRQRGEMELGTENLVSEVDRAAVESLRVYQFSGLAGTDEGLPF